MEITIETALKQGTAAHKAGNLQEAERFYRLILKAQPKQPDANHNLGIIAIAVNRPDMALKLFKTALEVNPKVEQFWLSYVDALIQTKRFDIAKKIILKGKKYGVSQVQLDLIKTKLIQKSKDLTPPKAQIKKLEDYFRTGRYSDAAKLAMSITHEFPDHPFSWKVMGAALVKLGQLDQALGANKTAVKINPQDASAHCNLGLTLHQMNRFTESLSSFRRAIDLKSDYADAYYNLGVTFQKMGRLEEAEASYEREIKLNGINPEAYNNLGATLKEMGRLEDAKTTCERALTINSNFAEAHNNLGVILQDLGKFKEAEASFKRAIKIKANYTEAHRHISAIKKFEKRDQQYLKMLELYRDESISEIQRCQISFGLAKANDDLKDFKQAFNYYVEGNALRKKHLKYNISQDVEIFNQLKANYPQIKKTTFRSKKADYHPTPIFVIGMPRSGTTLVEQIISSHSQVSGAGELPFAMQLGDSIARGISKTSANSIINFREKYLEKLQKVSNSCPMVSDKTPQNFLYLGLLSISFPEAKIVHISRNPPAVCWANYKQYFVSKSIRFCYDLDDIIQYHELYENIMKFWDSMLTKKIYNINYERLTLNQADETRKLIDYLGLNWEESCLSPEENVRSVATASNMQVRNKVYQGSSHQWKKFKPFLNGKFDFLDQVKIDKI